MDNRIQLYVMGLTYSQIQSGAYALILAQVDGPYRIPVVIGASEAQAIAIKLEGITPPRPMTHDLFESFVHAFGIKLLEVYIYKFEDGVFSSELTFTDGERTIVIDSRTSDAIAIALRTKAPIFTTPEILNETGFVMEETPPEHGSDEPRSSRPRRKAHPTADKTRTEPKLENYTIEQLEESLARAIEKEQYEQAAKIQAVLKAKKGI